MSDGIPLGTIAGLPVRANWSVLVLLWLFAWSLATTLPQTVPGYHTRDYWVAGVIGAVVLQMSLLAHEATHAVVARRAGMEVSSVTLWMFGGVTRIEGRSPDSANPVLDRVLRSTHQLDLVALMIDGVHLAKACCIVALGINIDGVKHPLALVEGSTENATLVTDLLVDLRERCLDVTRPMLVGLDGSKGLRKAILDVLDHPVIQRCQLHKIRNVKDHLPQ